MNWVNLYAHPNVEHAMDKMALQGKMMAKTLEALQWPVIFVSQTSFWIKRLAESYDNEFGKSKPAKSPTVCGLCCAKRKAIVIRTSQAGCR